MAKEKKYSIEDFKINELGPPEGSGVYCVGMCNVLTKAKRIVYIGSSKNIAKRILSPGHVYRKLLDRSSFAVYSGSIVTDDYLNLEKSLINQFKPLLNKQHKY